MFFARETTERASDPSPSANGGCERISRRSLLLSMPTLPLLPPSASLFCIKSPQGSLVKRNGWVLRADDVERLAIA